MQPRPKRFGIPNRLIFRKPPKPKNGTRSVAYTTHFEFLPISLI